MRIQPSHTLAARSTVAIATAAMIALVAPAVATNDLADSLQLLERLERTRVTIDVSETPIDQVLAELAAAAGVQIRTDWSALEALTVDADDRVSFSVRDVPADAAIAALLSSIGLPGEHPLHDVGSGQVVVTTIDRMAALRRTDVYDLRPLLGDGAAETALDAALLDRDRRATTTAADPTSTDPASPHSSEPAPSPPAAPPAPPAPPAAGPGESAPAPPDESTVTRSRGARLVALILDHVDPEAWLTAGGLRGRMDERDGTLIVTATPRTHRQVRGVLAQLAALRPTTLAMEVAVVEIDRTVLELARRRHRPGSAALARAILATEGVAIPWRGGGPSAFGEALRLESRSGDRRVVATILPRMLGPDGRASLEVDATVADAAGERRATTTATVAPRDSALILDLGDSGPTATVLVILAAAHG
jgi:hypothetical protein